jgi:hypothetical protein
MKEEGAKPNSLKTTNLLIKLIITDAEVDICSW